MKKDTRRAATFISGGVVLAVLVGVVVWQVGSPAGSPPVASESHHSSLTTPDTSENSSSVKPTSSASSMAPAPSPTKGTARKNSHTDKPVDSAGSSGSENDNSANKSEVPPTGTSGTARPAYDHNDPYLPPNAVLPTEIELSEPTTVVRPTNIGGSQEDSTPSITETNDGADGGSGTGDATTSPGNTPSTNPEPTDAVEPASETAPETAHVSDMPLSIPESPWTAIPELTADTPHHGGRGRETNNGQPADPGESVSTFDTPATPTDSDSPERTTDNRAITDVRNGEPTDSAGSSRPEKLN